MKVSDLRSAISRLTGKNSSPAEYQIASTAGRCFIGISPAGHPALLVPIEVLSPSAGRSGGGFALTHAARVAFTFGEHRWHEPAAILECNETALAEHFLVLAADIADRASHLESVSWIQLVEFVDDWQELLARRALLPLESQLGLWGELWLLTRAKNVDRLMGGWRSIDRDAIDFFLDGVGLEVKTSRRRRIHHVSQSQIGTPKGDFHAFVASLWVSVDPEKGLSLFDLVESGMSSVSNPAQLLRHISATGFSALDREDYDTKMIVLEEPALFRTEDIPQVRTADPGVSQLRYLVTIDDTLALGQSEVTDIWTRFLGRSSPMDVI